MKNKNVVVTGGAGFIGANLAKELATNNNVIIIDDLSAGKKEDLTETSWKSVEFIEGSIGDFSLLKKLCKNVDFVFHQAAIASVAQSIANPPATNEANVTGTLNVLWAARESGVRKVIFASSAAVYGDTASTTQREEMMPNPQSPYAVTKLVGEYYCQAFQAVYGSQYFESVDPNSPLVGIKVY